jgi:hypothetical protein
VTLTLIRPRSDARWYDAEGNPVLSVPYADAKRQGETRRPDLRDARKWHFYPSVTSVLGILDKPAVDAWMAEQYVTSALTLPRRPGETEDDFAQRVIADANAERIRARDMGAELHDLFRDCVLGRGVEHAGEHRSLMRLFDIWWQSTGYQCLAAEQRFVDPEMGYAGMADCIATRDGETYVVDWKTSNARDGERVTFYPEWALQLSAYAHGLGLENAKLVSVVVSRDTLGVIQEHVWTDRERWWAAWHAVFVAWQMLNNYMPGRAA